MSGELVALIVGLCSAAATVVVGLVTTRHAKRDARENIARDIAIVKSLQGGSPSRIIYEDLISYRIFKLSVEERTRPTRVTLWLFFVVGQVVIVTRTVRSYLAEPGLFDKELDITFWMIFAAFPIIGSLFLIDSWQSGRRLVRLVRNEPSRPRTKWRFGRVPAAFRAAWQALRESEDTLNSEREPQ